MSSQQYAALQQDESAISKSEASLGERPHRPRSIWPQLWKLPIWLFLTAIILLVGVTAFERLTRRRECPSDGLASQAAFFPQCEQHFQGYRSTLTFVQFPRKRWLSQKEEFSLETIQQRIRHGIQWCPVCCQQLASGVLFRLLKLTAVGSGYLRVPKPRQYELAPSVPIKNDTEDSEIFQASVIHQLHCVVRGYTCRFVIFWELTLHRATLEPILWLMNKAKNRIKHTSILSTVLIMVSSQRFHMPWNV